MGSRIFTGEPEAYECLKCVHEWRQHYPWRIDDDQGVSCPRCGHLYVEWLSFDTHPSDVFFRDDDVPDGVVRVNRSEDLRGNTEED